MSEHLMAIHCFCQRSFIRESSTDSTRGAFSRADLLASLAITVVLAVLVLGSLAKHRARDRLVRCTDNLRQVSHALLNYSADHAESLPVMDSTLTGDLWWWYKEKIRHYAGLSGPSSAQDTIFACPLDRGYTDPQPFWKTPRFDYGSYVFNGVTLPGVPNIAGYKVSTIARPARTLLVTEWTAHAPLSWHRSRTGRANSPFYRDAESVLSFVDGHVSFSKIYYDGYSAAYTRDPIPGYDYQYSGR